MGWYSSDPTFKLNHGDSKTFVQSFWPTWVNSCLGNMSDSGAALVTLDETKTQIFFPDILLSYNKTLHKNAHTSGTQIVNQPFLYLKSLLRTSKTDEIQTCVGVRVQESKAKLCLAWWTTESSQFKRCVFTPIPWLSAPQSSITELRELLHQDVTASAGMEAGHLRSGSRDIQIKSKTSEREAQGRQENREN